MKVLLLSAVLLVSLAAPPLQGQEPANPSTPPAPTVDLFAGLGSGPISAAAWGLGFSVPLSRGVAATAEISAWGNGLGGTECIAMPPESHRCSVSGWAGQLGLRVSQALSPQLRVSGEVGTGRFRRNGIGDERVYSAAYSMKAGATVQIRGPLEASLGGRFLRVFDSDYEALFQENLSYVMGTIGFGYRLGS